MAGYAAALSPMQKKNRLRLVAVEQVEHAWRDLGIGAVVECEIGLIARGRSRRQADQVRTQHLPTRPKHRGGQQQMVTGHHNERPQPERGLDRDGNHDRCVQQQGNLDGGRRAPRLAPHVKPVLSHAGG